MHSNTLANPDDCVFSVFQDAAARGKKRTGKWVDLFDLRGDLPFLSRRIVKMSPSSMPKREQRKIVLATLEGLQARGMLRQSRSGRWIFRKSLMLEWDRAQLTSATKGRGMTKKTSYVNSPPRRHPIPVGG